MLKLKRMIIALAIALAVFSLAEGQDRRNLQVKPLEKNEQETAVKKKRQIQAKKEALELAVRANTNFIGHTPSDQSVITNRRPTFKVERDSNRRSDTSSACEKSALKSNNAVLTVIELGTADSSGDVSVVQTETVNIAPDCAFEVKLQDLTLKDNTAYAWSVVNAKEEGRDDVMWHSFFYTTQPVDTSNDKTPPHLCEKNHVMDGSLLTREKEIWRAASLTRLQNQSIQIIENGHDDSGAIAFENSREIAYQQLAQRLRQSQRYQMKLSAKNVGKSSFQIKVIAFNGRLSALTPSQDLAVVAITGNMRPFDEWVKVTLPAWTSTGDFENLGIIVSNAQGRPISALIDQICFGPSSDTSCGPSVDMSSFAEGVPDIPDNTEPVETEFEYLAGSVNDIYSNQNTGSTDWYGTADAEVLQCSSIGGSFAPGQEDEIDELVAKTEGFVAANAQDLSDLEDMNVTVPDENALTLPQVGNVNDEKCTARIVDPSRPFSGRDVVYVHGLQKAALDGYKERPPLFSGRWPADAEEFNAPGGEYYDASATYWSEHIKAGLGDMSLPSNTYLIANWSTNQHIPEAVNAILTQVSDAMSGRNVQGITPSKSAKGKDQCFGDNGIIFVTHSTGGLVVSTLFGYIEKNKNNPRSSFYISQDMYDKLDGQIGFNAAYGGSPIASAGLVTHSQNRLNHIMGDAVRDIFGDGPSSGAVGFDPFRTVMADLGLPQYISYYKSIMDRGAKPTLTVAGTLTGASAETASQTGAELLIRGYNDGVLSSWVQTSHRVQRPKYKVKNALKLIDMGATPIKATSMVAKGKTIGLGGKFRYYVTPYLAPSGMLQAQSVDRVDDPRSYIRNHYPIIQTSGDHFDNVNKADRNGMDYYRPMSTSKRNNEESNVIHTQNVYNQGLMADEFADLTNEWVKKKTWGFHFVKVVWVRKERRFLGRTIRFRVPKLTWHYYEYTLWQRKYHLLEDYKTKRAVNYVYDYAFKD